MYKRVNRSRLFQWMLLLSLMVCEVSQVWGQGAKGAIAGIITDPTGAVVVGATLTATNLNTGIARTATSQGDGFFKILLLDPGQYRIEVSVEGFKKQVREPITVVVTETTDLRNLQLEVGSITEKIVVAAEAPVLQTSDATLGKVFDQKLMVELPLVTRNFTQLLSLQPGVVADIPNGASFGKGTQGFSVGGSRYYDNSVTIDGVNATGSSTSFGMLAGVAVPSPDAVQEFKVQTQMYSAEYGRAGGANVNLVTKTGTNQFHGNLFEFFRNDVFNANEYFHKRSQIGNHEANNAPILRQNQFGGTFGGPIKKDKTFFFGSYQGTRQLNGAAPGFVFSNASYPYLPPGDRGDTAKLRADLGAIFGGRTGFPFGMLLPDGTPVNYILPDGSNISPVALKILQAKLPDGQYLLPSFAASSRKDGQGGRNGGQVFSDASFSFPGKFNEDQYMVNVDHLLSARQIVSGKFFYSDSSITSPAGNTPGFTNVGKPRNTNASLTHTFSVNPTLVNELRLGYLRIVGSSAVDGAIKAADVGMKSTPGSSVLPLVAIATQGVMIGNNTSYSNAVENQYSITNTVAKTWGSHSLRFGGTFIRHQLALDVDVVRPGQLIIFGFNDFLLGADAKGNHTNLLGPGFSNILSTAASTGTFAKAFRFSDFGAFVQDEWKVRQNLTLTMGLRWDYYQWPIEKNGLLGSFDPTLIAEGAFGIPAAGGTYSGYTLARSYVDKHPGAVIPAGVTLVNDSLINENSKRNFAPRFGFSWSPLRKLAIRGGYGLFFQRVSAEMAQAQMVGPPFNNTSLVSFTPNGNLEDPFTFLNLPPDSAYPTWQPRTYVENAAASVFLAPVSSASKNPYTQQWNFGVQYEIRNGLLAEVAYMGSHGIKLLNTMAGNQPGIASVTNPIRGITTNTNDPGNVQGRSPVAGIVSDRGIAMSATNAASKYNALLASVTKRYSRGLQFLSTITYGKSTDTNTIGLDGSVGNAQPPGDNNYNNHWGLSTFDRKFRLTSSVVYDIPNPLKNRGKVLRFIGAGWGTSAVLTIQSGPPITLAIDQSKSAVKLQGFLTPNMKPGTTLKDVEGHGSVKDRLTNYFGTGWLGSGNTVFEQPGPLNYGQLGRGLAIRAPGQKNLDLAITRNFRFGPESQKSVMFRGEAFNAFNWVNFGGPGTSVSDSSFGIISSTTTAPRIIQLALKLIF